jgi:TRAP-type uncharacterized transport system substrate-binding protein
MTLLSATGDESEVTIVMDLHGRRIAGGEERCGKKIGREAILGVP